MIAEGFTSDGLQGWLYADITANFRKPITNRVSDFILSDVGKATFGAEERVLENAASYLPRAKSSKGLSNRVDARQYVDKNIENTNNQLKAVFRSEKGTITTFELFLEGHSADSAI